MKSKDFENALIGENTIVEDNVTLGLRYHPECGGTVIGDNSIIRCGTVIYADVKIGDYFQSGHNTLIRARVEMGDFCTLTNGATIEGMVKMGNSVRLMSNCYVASRTCFEDRIVCGPNVVFLNEKYPGRVDGVTKGAYVESDVMIGGGAVILPGVRIGERSFIAAGALVTKDVPKKTLAVGVPAKFYPLPEELDCPCSPEMAMQKADLWHPLGPSPFSASWPEEYGEPPVTEPVETEK
ncbi:MAG: N-acetyltransferase [Clostridia bacterium]|nr:N-acetyltransferase [Clostridia bacterium]